MDHVIRQHHEARVNAFVFIGDTHEEKVETLVSKATRLGEYGVPIFFFHEAQPTFVTSIVSPTPSPIGDEAVFKLMAERSGGVYLPFDQHSADRFRDLLAGIAAYAAGGRAALAARPDDAAKLLVQHLK